MNKYYIYLHIKLTTGEPFYVGKGSGNRYISKKSRSQYWKNVVNKYDYDSIILEEDLTEQEAFEKEIYWIKRIGRENLVNHTDGGEGTSGLEPWNKGKKCPQFAGENNYFYGKNIGRKGEDHPMYNKNHSQESKEQTSKTLKERYKNTEHHLKNKPAKNRKKVIFNVVEYESVKALLDSKVISRANYYKNV